MPQTPQKEAPAFIQMPPDLEAACRSMADPLTLPEVAPLQPKWMPAPTSMFFPQMPWLPVPPQSSRERKQPDMPPWGDQPVMAVTSKASGTQTPKMAPVNWKSNPTEQEVPMKAAEPNLSAHAHALITLTSPRKEDTGGKKFQ